MSRRLKIIILIVILIVVIALLVYLVYRLTRSPEVSIINGNVSGNVSEIKGLEDNDLPEVIELAELSPVKREELLTRADLERFSVMFAERYASYSNQVDYANWLDLEVFMTAKMRQEIESQIAALAAEELEVYQGFTAKALATKIVEYDSLEDKAVVEVTLQQRKAEGHSDNYQVVYQKLILNFNKKTSQGWKVDSVQWK